MEVARTQLLMARPSRGPLPACSSKPLTTTCRQNKTRSWPSQARASPSLPTLDQTTPSLPGPRVPNAARCLRNIPGFSAHPLNLRHIPVCVSENCPHIITKSSLPICPLSISKHLASRIIQSSFSTVPAFLPIPASMHSKVFSGFRLCDSSASPPHR